MTAHKSFKRHVRQRARRTGESYTAALAQVRARPDQEPPPMPTSAAPLIVVSGPAGVGKSTVAHLVAASFDRAVHLKADDLVASVVSGWVDPGTPEAAQQDEAIGGALAVSAMGFAGDGYTAVIDGHVFAEGVVALAAACRRRELGCHYAVLSADLETCWARALSRGSAPAALRPTSFAAVHRRYAQVGSAERHVIDAGPPAEVVAGAVLTALRHGRMEVGDPLAG